MKQKILICIFSIIFGILIGINVPKAEASKTPEATELMEMQSGQMMNGMVQYETTVVNGKRLVIFKCESGECMDIELFW